MRKPRGSREYAIRPIGFVRSDLLSPDQAPKQGAPEGTEADIVVDPAYADALEGLEHRVRGPGRTGASRRGSGKIIVLCWMHEADRGRRRVHPRDRTDQPQRGVFATRSPHRPNPISLHTVELVSLRGNVLRIRGMDAVDGTPVLDIKPHVPELDG